MSDRQHAVLASIDAALTACICGQPIPTDGPSLDYCSDVCQYGWTAGKAGAVSELEGTWPISHGTPNGRDLNHEVARELERSQPMTGMASASVVHFGDTGNTASVTWVPHMAGPAPTMAELAEGVDLTPYLGLEPYLVRRTIRTGDQVTLTLPDGHTTHSTVTGHNPDGSYSLEPAEGEHQ